MPVTTTKAAASSQGYGEFTVSAPKVYIEDVFSTYLYTGTGSTQTITNGIDLSTKGGLVWLKGRSGGTDHALYDTARGTTKDLVSNSTAAETTQSTGLTAFNTTGFSIGALAKLNTNADTYVSWTFRKQPKFFDVVTYTGNGTAGRTISHNLGATPGMVVVKNLSVNSQWAVYHRSLNGGTGNGYLWLQSTNAASNLGRVYWGDGTTFTAPTSTQFTISNDGSVNNNGETYVAYLFAHDAGGFGLTGTDNVISCGSYTGNGSSTGPTTTLGYEPQWLLVKPVSNTGGAWQIGDVMRDMSLTNFYQLLANSSAAELNTTTPYFAPTPTGFQVVNSSAAVNGNGWSYIYIAIRRGPMKVPTSGTQVFSPITRTGTGVAANITTAGFTPDLLIGRSRLATTSTPIFADRLRGNTKFLQSAFTDAEGTSSAGSDVTGFLMNGFSLGTPGGTDLNTSGTSEIYYPIKRAPGFFDVVCYTGDGAVSGSATRSINHNLQAVPELIICRARNDIDGWRVYSATLGINKILNLNQSSGEQADTTNWGTPTSSAFLIKYDRNWSGWNFVTYLFATVAGVSKVGSYTGNGSNQTINCGFTGGARFILIKRTDSTGDWYCWDSARGIVSGNDPHLSLNTTAAEVTTDDSVDTDSTGFIVNQLAATNINVSSASYIFLAVA